MRYFASQKNILTILASLALFLFCVAFHFHTVVLAAPNYEINYQGKLTDVSGLAVTDGQYAVTFSLYTAAVGGTQVWTEDATTTITNGLFSVMLGSSTALTAIDFNQPLYLGVNVEGDGEMTPRKILGTVPAAFEARNASTVGGVASSSFLRSNQADTASGLLTFTGGFISQASSTITGLTTVTATTTNFVINGESFTDLTGTGLLNNAGVLTLNTSQLDTWYASTTDFDTSAELAGILTDETGTGNAVFSASPTFTGTIQASAATLSSTLTLSGTAANIALGSNWLSGDGGDEGIFVDADGNVGVGTSSPAYRLDIYGDARIDGDLYDAFGSAGSAGNVLQSTASGIQWVATSSLGIVGSGGDTISVGAAGNPAFIYSSSTSGSNVSVNFNGSQGAAPSFSGGVLTLPSDTETMIVEVWGAGGGGSGGGLNNAGDGSDGGSTCFGTNTTACTSPTISATGGTGGSWAGDVSPGGYGSGGDINLIGSGAGDSNINMSGATFYGAGMPGGSAPLGGGGGASDYAGAGGGGASFGGGGAGGGVNGGSSAGYANGSGAGGGGYSQKIISSPSGTYYYTIGSGGSAGTAGTSGSVGGSGGDGGIVITVYTASNSAVNGVASSSVAFSVHRNGTDQTGIVTSVNTAVDWTTEDFDTNDNFDVSTERFTPTIAGKYILNARAKASNIADGAQMRVFIYKNGSIISETRGYSSTANGDPVPSISTIVDANGTSDYFEVYVLHSHGSNRDLDGGSDVTHFSGALIAPSNGLAGGWSNNGIASYLADYTDRVAIGTTTASSKLTVYGDLYLEGSGRYLNFGTATGTLGYGFRDNAGTLEFKNSAGDWAAFGSGGAFTESGTSAYFNNNGNIAIGTTSTSSARLTIQGTSTDTVLSVLTTGGSSLLSIPNSLSGTTTLATNLQLDATSEFFIGTNAGFRLNAGVLQFKDSSNDWTDLATSGGGTTQYGLMESDWVDTGATLPADLYFSQTAVIGDYVYLFGGYDDTSATSSIYRAPVSDPTSWSDTGSALPGSLQSSQLAIINENIYLFGGSNGSASDVIYVASTSNPTTWVDTGATLPDNLYRSQVVVLNNNIYLFGGVDSSTYTDVIYVASTSDPTTWVDTGATLPNPVSLSQVSVIGNYLYLFGARNSSGFRNYIYRAPVSDPTSWSDTGSVLPSVFAHSQLAIIGDYVYLLGGSSTGAASDVVYRAPVSDPTSWINTGSKLPAGLSRSQTSVIGNYVYLFGGLSAGLTTNVIYRAPIYTNSPNLASNKSWKEQGNSGTEGANGLGVTGQLGYYASNNTSSLTATSSLYLASNGYFGIGTTSPTSKLTVYGNALLEGSNRYLNFGTTAGTLGYGFRDNAGTLEFKNAAGDWAAFGSGGAFTESGTSAYFNNSGNIAIGTTSTSGARLIVQSTSTENILSLFETGGQEVFTVLENGNVGVGDLTPASLFTVGNGDLFQVNSSGDIITQSVGVDALESEDFGDFTCNGTTCTLDASYLTTVDISDDTNLAGDAEIVLTNDTLSIAASIARDSELHDAVTLGGEDYLSLSTQLITANAINPDNLASADFGDFTCNGTNCSLDADTVAAAEMANSDHGFFSYSSGVASLDTGGLTSANLIAALTNETGSGSSVFSTSPTLTTPNLGTPSAVTLTNATGLPLSTGVTGVLGIANGGLNAAFTDPDADRLMFWDDSASSITGITTLSGASISGTTLTITDVTCTDCLTTTEIADSYVLNTGDSISGNLTFSGAAANIALGSNFLSGDGGDEGVAVDSSGNVGVGVAGPDKRLEVFETVADDQFRISYDATRYADFQVDSVGDLVIDAQGGDVRLNDENLWVCTGGSCPSGTPAGTGNVIVEGSLGVGTSSPRASVEIWDELYVANGNASGLGQSTSTFQGDVLILGKLDVGTIDPVYRIDDTKYATFGMSSIGVKESVNAMFNITEFNSETGYFETRIAWSELQKASDLWLFYQVTNFGENWEKLIVSLTPSFDGKVFYTKDVGSNALVIQSTLSGEVSAHLSADRFDADEWSNVRDDQDDPMSHFELQSKE